jgi:prevent-host-death family protein
MNAVGVRELRQNLSGYLRRVANGERFLVTDHREPVAVLGPPPTVDDPWEALIAEGRMSRPTKDLADLRPPVRLDDPYALTKALEEQREERLP